jgi:uncharacterized damage-inducible protein DinB
MTSIPLWFERKFDFSFPAELYPNICMRLRGTPTRLEEMLRGCPPELLLKRPLEQGKEKWSVQEHAGHLLDLEPLWLARVEDFLTDGAELTVADLQNQKTHNANHNAHPIEEILAGFRKERMTLMQRLETMETALSGRKRQHPRMKTPMRLVDHLFFVAEHDDHHLAHTWEIIQRTPARGRS